MEKCEGGGLSLCIDSDDELMLNACEICWNTWKEIPESEKKKYWQIKAQCIDDDGKVCDALFPENINELPLEERYKFFSHATGERIGCRVTSIMRKNLFPEPEGVKCVYENIVWAPLERKYLSWGINDIIRIWHKDANERQTIVNKMRVQQCKDMLFACTTYLNDTDMYISNSKNFIKTILKYLILRNILTDYGENKFAKGCIIRRRFLPLLFTIPCHIVSPVIRRTRCDF